MRNKSEKHFRIVSAQVNVRDTDICKVAKGHYSRKQKTIHKQWFTKYTTGREQLSSNQSTKNTPVGNVLSGSQTLKSPARSVYYDDDEFEPDATVNDDAHKLSESLRH